MQIDTIDRTTRNLLTSSIRQEFKTGLELFLRFDDCVFLIETNEKRLEKKLRNYFNAFVIDPQNPDIVVTAHEAPALSLCLDLTEKQPDPGKHKIKEEFAEIKGGRVVRKRLTGMVFIFGNGDNLAVGPCLENDNQVINFINNRYIEWRLNQGGVLGHAAGVSLNGRGLALAGFSGMGKSTLALRILGLGADFVSNDRLIVQASGEKINMYGVAKHPRINPGTILNNKDVEAIIPENQRRIYQKLTPNELWMLEHKYDALIHEYYGKGRFILHSTMNALVILNWKQGGEKAEFNQIKITERMDLLPAFMKETGLFYHAKNGRKSSSPSFEDYIDILSNCDVFEITGGAQFDQAAHFCREYLTGAGNQNKE